MDYQRPDQDGRVEDDFVRPLKPVRSMSTRRLPAALPLAIAGILVVSSVALGATVMKNIVISDETPTPVIIGDATDEPTAEITEAPGGGEVTEAPATEAPVVSLSLTIDVTPGKACLTWSKYDGADFAYYKVVKGSSGGVAAWPLGEGDELLAAIDNQDTTQFCAKLDGEFTFAVYAVKSGDSGYEVLAASLAVTVTVPEPTPAPTKKPTPPSDKPAVVSMTLRAELEDRGDGYYIVHLIWSKYNGTYFNYYGIMKTGGTTAEPADPALPAPHGDTPWWYSSDQDQTSQAFTFKQGSTDKIYKFRIWAYTEHDFAFVSGGVQPLCYVGNNGILGVSPVIRVVIPAKVVEPTPGEPSVAP
jgi:hypothetical protein